MFGDNGDSPLGKALRQIRCPCAVTDINQAGGVTARAARNFQKLNPQHCFASRHANGSEFDGQSTVKVGSIGSTPAIALSNCQ